MKKLLISVAVLTAGFLLYAYLMPDITLNDGVAMYKLTRRNPKLIFVCGEDNDGYYHIETRGTRFLWWLARHTAPQESYELCFRNEQTMESIKQTLEAFKRRGINISKVLARIPEEREFDVSSDGELIEPQP